MSEREEFLRTNVIMHQISTSILLLIVAAGLAASCSNRLGATGNKTTCGPGTHKDDGQCVIDDDTGQIDGNSSDTQQADDGSSIDTEIESEKDVAPRKIDSDEADDGPRSYNNSQLVDNDLPYRTPCNKPNSSAIAMRNTGTTTWTNEAGYKLGAVGGSDPLYSDSSELLLPLDAAIAPNDEWTFEFDILGPENPGTYSSDWQMMQQGVGAFGEIVTRDVEVYCPDTGGGTGDPEPPTDVIDCSDGDKDKILESAKFVKATHPEFFDIEYMDDLPKRKEAYKMMTIVINDLRAKGVNASRCIANPGLPESDPFLWCSDALVCGSPGKANTIDIYQSWSSPANPQVLITETGSSGVVTSDLIPLP
ncbi:MAG TPA: hypothetical protein EYN06_01080 [Myxococcales bacterium]|nr:hypothetical protein [Myxococcales bacterium]HIN85043.1 hypothetical protein [Myxococcales bacterium]